MRYRTIIRPALERGHGKPDDLARMAKPAIDLIGQVPAAHEAPVALH
jgi:hypothetical protein